MKNSYYLFLDDVREPSWVWWVELPKTNDWVIVRSYKQFVEFIEKNGVPSFVSFEHDLDRNTRGIVISPITGQPDGVNVGNGLDCAKWLIEYCKKNKLQFPAWIVHSTNAKLGPKISEYIQNFLDNEYGK